MGKFELSLSSNYVSDWGVQEGVRELYQNASDQEIVDPTNEMFHDYDSDTEILQIGNLKSVLEISTLLLGATTKAESTDTIGHFGEGYKVGTLALIRAGKTVIFKNYGAKEIWRPRFVKSKRYGGALVLTFFTEKQMIWNPVPHHNLVVEIGGITQDEYDEIAENNLHINKPVFEYDAGKYGRILLDEELRGKIFVNGLFIERVDKMHYGYDLMPKYVKLGRDRKTVDDFTLRDKASYMWAEQGDVPELLDLIQANAPDINYLDWNSKKSTNTVVHDDFREKHGNSAIPVTDQDEMEEAKKKYPDCKPVIVNPIQKTLIIKADEYKVEAEEVEVLTLAEEFTVWYNKLDTANISDELFNEFDELVGRIDR